MIGPVDVPEETNSGLVLLNTNNTLMPLALQGKNGPRKPVILEPDQIKSTETVMEYAQPKVKVKLKTGNKDNPEVSETINFQGGVEAFSPKSIKKNSKWLRSLEAEFEASEELVGRIDKNAQFRKALDDPKSRAAIVALFKHIVNELDESLTQEEEE